MKRLLIYAVIYIAIAAFALDSVHAQGLGEATSELGRAGAQAGVTDVDDPALIVGRAINVVLSLMGLIFLVLMVYAGFIWMTARGEEEKVTKARKIIISSLIGLVIVVSAYAIAFLVTSRLGQ